jgi:SAM-dependent methyltransferase
MTGMESVMGQLRCQICEADRLQILDTYADIPRVTSDCKPWPAGGKMSVCHSCGAVQKIPDAAWFEDINRIYGGYQIYDLSAGAEQVIFNSEGEAAPRSRLLVEFIRSNVSLALKGRLIDLGCGNGAALESFSKALPDWKLYGSELSEAASPFLNSLPNFVQLFTAEPRDIGGAYDLVSMIHSLEHMPFPSRTLAEALRLLSDDGVFFVEIPDVETSPFDLVVADHLGHFSRATLRYLFERNGFSVQTLRNDLLPKENTLLARRGNVDALLPDAAQGIFLANRNVAWLHAVIDRARQVASRSSQFGIFGTSISGTWLFGALRDEIDFFVDEDKTRVGQKLQGRPIIAPSEVPKGADVFVPLIPSVAEKVFARLAPLGIRFIAPPTFSVSL